MDEDKSLAELISVSFVGGAIGRGFQYFINLFIARALGPSGFGVFTFGLVLLNSGSIIAKLGLDNAVKKYTAVYSQREDPEKLSGTILFSLGVVFLFGIVVSVVIYFVVTFAREYNILTIDGPALLFLFGVPLMAVMTVGMYATTGFLEAKYMVYVRDFGQAGSAVLFVYLVLYFISTVESVIVAYVLSFVMASFLSIGFLYRQGAFDWGTGPEVEVKKLLNFSLPLMFASVIRYLTRWTDILMLSTFENAAVVGQYQAANIMTTLLAFLLFSFNSVYPPIAADLYEQDSERLRSTFVVATKWLTYLTALGYLFFVFFAEEILLLFGTEFTAGREVLLVLGLVPLVGASVGPVGNLLSMTDYERLEFVNTGTVAVLNLVLNFFLIQEYGFLGAAIATAISMSLLNIARVVETWLLLGIRPMFSRYWKGVIAICVAVLVMYIGSAIEGPWLLLMIVTGVISLGVFLAVMKGIGLDDEDQLLVESFL